LLPPLPRYGKLVATLPRATGYNARYSMCAGLARPRSVLAESRPGLVSACPFRLAFLGSAADSAGGFKKYSPIWGSWDRAEAQGKKSAEPRCIMRKTAVQPGSPPHRVCGEYGLLAARKSSNLFLACSEIFSGNSTSPSRRYNRGTTCSPGLAEAAAETFKPNCSCASSVLRASMSSSAPCNEGRFE
jgi:hypothetical protein